MSDPSVPGPAEGDCLALGSSVDVGRQVLGAALDPAHWASQQAGQLCHHDLLFGDHALGAEPAADVFHQHPNISGFHVQRFSHPVPEAVGSLGAGPAGQFPVGVVGSDHSGLDGYGGYPGVPEFLGDHGLASGEVDGALGRDLPHDVVGSSVE